MAVRLSWTGSKVILFCDEINGIIGNAGKDSGASAAVRTMMLDFLEGAFWPKTNPVRLLFLTPRSLSGSTGQHEGIHVVGTVNAVWEIPKNAISRFRLVSRRLAHSWDVPNFSSPSLRFTFPSRNKGLSRNCFKTSGRTWATSRRCQAQR